MCIRDRYEVTVTHHDLGCESLSHVRGSPFVVQAADPWTKHRVMGPTPAQRKAPTLQTLGGQLVLFGGDKSGAYTLNTTAADWRWAPLPLPEGAPGPPDRTLHAAAAWGDRKLVVFAGVNLADQSELADVWVLQVRFSTLYGSSGICPMCGVRPPGLQNPAYLCFVTFQVEKSLRCASPCPFNMSSP